MGSGEEGWSEMGNGREEDGRDDIEERGIRR